MRRRKFARVSVITLTVLLNGSLHAADDDTTSTGAIHPADIVTTIAQAWSLALQVAVRHAADREALQAIVDRESVEATRRFGTVACGGDADDARDPLALLATRRIDEAIGTLKDYVTITYRSQFIAGRLAVTFEVKAANRPP